MPRLPDAPDLDWTEEGTPRARRFDDVYHARGGGLAESEAVFLAGCGLPGAWSDRRTFTIVELGFGAGLNALAVHRLWRETRPPGAVLHMMSIEAAPMRAADAARAHAAFPEIAALSQALIARWPVRAFGAQRLWFEADAFALTVVHGDVGAALAQLPARADAIFLDGFAPARNPAMWSADTIAALARIAAPGARIATYSVAGDVRRALAAQGFAVEKAPGFGAKRERLQGRFTGAPTMRAGLFPTAPSSAGRVAIVGAGIAGACLADALRRRGREVALISRGDDGASFNRAALVAPRLDRDPATPVARLHLNAFIEAVRFYEARDAFEARGVIEFARPGLDDLLADPPLPEDWFARAADDAALHRRAGVIAPRAVLARLLDGCAVRAGAVASIARTANGWRLCDAAGAAIIDAASVVIANGAGLAAFAQSAWAPVRAARGQLEFARGARMEGAVMNGAYAAPCAGGVVFGATFDPVAAAHCPEPDDASRARNLASLAALAPATHEEVRGAIIESRASLRATTPDRSPLLGLMPDSAEWLRVYKDIAFGRTPRETPPPRLEGLYAFGGLGARGFTLAPLLSETLASEMCGEPRSLAWDVLDAIHPARFLLRKLKRRENILL
ncbi:MAG: FAD-dependent 5-carboxymethylaminomethyl-2-thiouridine(34) oxidoreductase MnmC [Alphaproteobacteria bacterium]|nr:FAD-dependent 5-carboxymethylaminomethyl-2-thiouridine(34) oxidoreductase MnmC [Alphaproteobacteria bacterium]